MKTITALIVAAAMCALCNAPPANKGSTDNPSVVIAPDITNVDLTAVDNPDIANVINIGFAEENIGHHASAVTIENKAIPPAYKVVNIQDAGFAFEHHDRATLEREVHPNLIKIVDTAQELLEAIQAA